MPKSTVTDSEYSLLSPVKSEVVITGQSNLGELEILTLQCTAVPSASISWLKRNSDGIKLLASGRRTTLSTKEVAVDGKMATLSTLTVTNVTEVDSGDYLCEAQNGAESIPTTENIIVNINGE